MMDIKCYCNSPSHKEGRYEFKVYPPLYYSGKVIYCPKCNSSNITRQTHEGKFTLEDAMHIRAEEE